MSDDELGSARAARSRLNRIATAERRAALTLTPHDIATLKLCVASAWVHGFISTSRAHELAQVLRCKPGELEAFRVTDEEEVHADD